MSITINHESFTQVGVKVTDLRPGKAYRVADMEGSAVIFGCLSGASIDVSGRTVYGVDTNGQLWHSGDTEPRFVEVNVTISGG